MRDAWNVRRVAIEVSEKPLKRVTGVGEWEHLAEARC
jgi:hypothetical protein